MPSAVSHVVLRKAAVKRDWKLAIGGAARNNGRKVLVTELRPATEEPIGGPEWMPGPEHGKTPVLATGVGGTEVATFTERAGQERHKHLVGTEIYTVLEGVMRISLNDAAPIRLRAGDEVIILPGTIHEVVRPGAAGGYPLLVVRVHSLHCHGDSDKYVQLEAGGEWLPWQRVPAERRPRVYRKFNPVR